MTMTFDELTTRESRSILQTYKRYPLALYSGRGTKVFDINGREYTDLMAGIAVCNLGHGHPEIAEVVARKSQSLLHVSNLVYTEEQVLLAEKLLATCSLNRIFFCNSGAEANEAAIKLCRRFMSQVAKRNAFEIIALKGSFHGRTLGALAATGQDALKLGFDPLPQGFRHVPVGDFEALQTQITGQTAGVMLEVVQGESGVRPLPADYLKAVEVLCRKHDLLFIIDEIQTGLGRTGKMWAHEHHGLKPDIFTTAKGLANGLPMGAMLASEKLAAGLPFGSHATTFGGGPLLSAVALKVIEIIERDHLAEKAAVLGASAMRMFQSIQADYPDRIKDVRGLGLMIGVELGSLARPAWEKLLEAGYLLNLSHESVLRLLPPLIISEQELTDFATTLRRIISSLK